MISPAGGRRDPGHAMEQVANNIKIWSGSSSGKMVPAGAILCRRWLSAPRKIKDLNSEPNFVDPEVGGSSPSTTALSYESVRRAAHKRSNIIGVQSIMRIAVRFMAPMWRGALRRAHVGFGMT